MAGSRKSTTEMKSLTKQEKTSEEDPLEEGLGRYKESEIPAPFMTSDVEKLVLSAPESCPTSGMPLTIEMPCLDTNDRNIEKTKQEKLSQEDLLGSEEPEKPMPCTSSDGFYAKRLLALDSSLTPVTPNVEMKNMHKPEEKVEKYLEIIDDVMIQRENVSDEGPHESRDEQPMPFTFVKFEAKHFAAQKPHSVSAATKNISIEMTYLHKKDEEKVDKHRYMTLDQDSKRREDLGRYKALSVPCMSSVVTKVRESSSESGASPASENIILNTDEYDEVVTENENSSGTCPGGYEEPDVVNSEQPPVPPPGGYEEHDVVNSEQPPVPGRSRSQRATSTTGETSVYQELQ